MIGNVSSGSSRVSQGLLKSMAPNATSYDGKGEGVIDVAGGIVNTVA